MSTRLRAGIIAGAFGASALIVQTEILRLVMTSAAGGTLAVGAALSAWLVWIAAGALAGGYFASKSGGIPRGMIAVSCVLAPAAAAGSMFYLAALRQLSGVPPGEMIPLGELCLHSAIACMPYAALTGLSFPLLSVLSSENRITVGSPAAVFIGGIWSAEALGAFAGGVVFTFLLAGRTSPAFNALIFGPMPLLGLLLNAGESHIRKTLSSAVFLLTAILVFITLPFAENRFDRLLFESLNSPGTLLESRWTKYRSLMLTELSGQYTLFDNGVPLASFPDQYNDAAATALLLGQNPSMHSALIVGNASSGIAQGLIAAGLSKVSAVHPDAVMEWLVMKYLPAGMLEPLRSGAYSYVQDDARAWMGRPRSGPAGPEPGPAGWDLVLINLEGPAHMNSSRYYTPGFFRLARGCLQPAGGLLALRLPIGAGAQLHAQVDQVAAVWSSLTRSFTDVALLAGDTECYLFAANSDSLLSISTAEIMKRLRPYEDKVPNLSRYLVPVLYDSLKSSGFERKVNERMPFAGIQTDFSPRAWLHNLRLWVAVAGKDDFTGTFFESLFSMTGRTHEKGLVFLPAILVTIILTVVWLVCAKSRKPQRVITTGTVITVAAAGFVAMGATVSFIYLCQIAFGALFHQVAMITAVFMLSLAAGSWWASVRAPDSGASVHAVTMLSFLLSVAVTLPALGLKALEPLQQTVPVFGGTLAVMVFYLSVAAVGLCCGMLFPYGSALNDWARDEPSTARTAARLDAADHLGAAAGALCVGVVAVPAMGIVPVASSMALAMLSIAVFWYLITDRQN